RRGTLLEGQPSRPPFKERAIRKGSPFFVAKI
ncbi:MAG: hypothetical protein ACI9YH_005016, partial [Colwellia sp.]